MPVINTVRPISVRKTGDATAVPSGTLASVTSDDLDSTYVRFLATGSASWSVRVQSHTPAAGYQRHAVRARIRARVDAGTAYQGIELGAGSTDYFSVTSPLITDTFAEYATGYVSSSGFGLGTAGALADINVGSDEPVDPNGVATESQIAEVYVDFDTRLWPDFTPQVQDNAGNDWSGGTITTTTQPDLFFGAVGYDGLPALDWTAEIRQGATVISTATGSGVPPSTLPTTVPLADGAYTAYFTVRSTIRNIDPFPRTIAINFTIHNVVPPPSPPLLTVVPQDGGYLVSWEFADGQPWDDDYVVAELWRDDCNESARIAVVPNGISGSYFDLAIPQLDPQPVAPDCDPVAEPCDITYRIRYWGYVSTTVEVPDTIPDGLILAWPGTAGTIPSGWSRVTALDTRYPRGATGTGAPSATGGANSHSHSGPAHAHSWFAHEHDMPGDSTGPGSGGVNVTFGDLGNTGVPSFHFHTMPTEPTSITRGQTSGSATPGTSSVNNTPPTREVIWIQSGGGQVAFPIGVLGFSLENISGWTADAASSGRYLRGAPAAGNGGLTYGTTSHTHTINAHSHTGFTHDHGAQDTSLATPVLPQNSTPGDNIGEFKPRHRHPVDVQDASTGNTGSNSGGTTGSNTLEPPHRRLRVLRNVNGGIQTRVIGLYVGAIADLNATLTLCNGSNGTPDMRTWFAREAAPNSVNTTGGSASHNHSTPNHSHTTSPHSHIVTVLPSQNPSKNTRGSAPTTSNPTPGHTHTGGMTEPYTVPVTTAGAGSTTTVSHLPTYREVHFVRLDGIVSGGPLDAPELKISEFASVTVPAFSYGDSLDRIATTTSVIAIAADREHSHPRIVADSTPLNGGLHTVHTTTSADVMTLSIGVEGKSAIDELESVLAAEQVYWSPVGGTPGWFAPAGWSTVNPAPGVWVVQISLTRRPWPDVVSPEEYL